MTTVTNALNLARSKLGVVESPPSSNNTEFGIWYGFNRVPWCAIFVSWVLAHAGLGSQYRHASVAYSLDAARKQGRRTHVFRPGYVACRINSGGDWGPGHTGIVEAVHSDGTVTTIEGNTSGTSAGSQRDGGGVWRRRRSKSYWNKQCIRIDFTGAPSGPAPTPPPSGAYHRCTLGHPTLQQGARGHSVSHLQHLLKLNREPMVVDGDFGPKTKSALWRFQTNWRLHVDGVAGPQSWGALHHVVRQHI